MSAVINTAEHGRSAELARYPNLRNGGPRGPGKVQASIKTMVEKALTKAGGVDYLARQAEENPVAFLGLVGRIVPLQVAAGDGSSPVHLHLLAAVEVSREILERQQQQQPPTIDAERNEVPQNLLDAPLPSE